MAQAAPAAGGGEAGADTVLKSRRSSAEVSRAFFNLEPSILDPTNPEVDSAMQHYKDSLTCVSDMHRSAWAQDVKAKTEAALLTGCAMERAQSDAVALMSTEEKQNCASRRLNLLLLRDLWPERAVGDTTCKPTLQQTALEDMALSLIHI